MTLVIDGGYVGFTLGAYHDRLLKAEQWAKQGAVFCFDHPTSLRKQKYSWYKASRKVEPAIKGAMRQLSKQFEVEIRASWPSQSISEPGLEADDIIAMCTQATGIVTSDHDMLQLTKPLYTVDMKPWGINRIKSKLPLKQGRSYLSYQLLTGCTSDSVPRSLFTADRSSLPWAFQQPDPLEAALSILTVGQATRTLNVILLPTPLWTGRNPVEQALETP